MKISAINNYCSNQMYKNTRPACVKTQTNSQIEQTPSFKGWRGATKGFGVLGAIGAGVGALVAIGTGAIIPTMIYFGVCNGIIGAAAGSHYEDNSGS